MYPQFFIPIFFYFTDKKIFTDRVGVIKSYDDELLYRIYNVYFDDLGDYPPQEHQFYSFEFFIIENK